MKTDFEWRVRRTWRERLARAFKVLFHAGLGAVVLGGLAEQWGLSTCHTSMCGVAAAGFMMGGGALGTVVGGGVGLYRTRIRR